MKNILIIIILTGLGFTQTLDSLDHKSSRKAALYGALFPGLGQVYNEKYFKSSVVLSLEAVVIYQWLLNGDIYKNYEMGDYSLPKHRYLEKRNKYAWWAVFVYVYGLIDAVVDAHLSPFNDVMNENIEKSEAN
ncbi:MAG: DUF5683 domain-containing protein [Fidelibacterota bacterium]